MISGGEPLEQPAGVLWLTTQLAKRGYRVEIDTNGTVVPEPALVAATDLFVVSPKLPNGASRIDRINTAALEAFVLSGRAVFVLAVDDQDVAELVELEQCLGLYPIWLVPRYTDGARVLDGMRRLAEHAVAHGWHLATPLGVLLGNASCIAE